MKKILSVLSICLLGAATSLTAQENTKLRMAIEGNHRSEANKARDVYRNPYETLTFFGVQSNHTVIEAWPSAGWYTEILAPYLKGEGKLIAATYDRSDNPPEAYMGNRVMVFDALLASNPAVYGEVVITEQVTERQSVLAEPGTVDAVLDFRNAHNWLSAGADNIIKAWYEALKPGGIVGLVDHRRDADDADVPGSGYIHVKQIADAMARHGFTLDASSEVNANPKDTKDYAGGVWILPPTLRRVEEPQRAISLAIGESDRMTLKFVKN